MQYQCCNVLSQYLLSFYLPHLIYAEVEKKVSFQFEPPLFETYQ